MTSCTRKVVKRLALTIDNHFVLLSTIESLLNAILAIYKNQIPFKQVKHSDAVKQTRYTNRYECLFVKEYDL